jgi:glutathione S-transferase
MKTLYHHPLCPFSRKVRIMFYEKNIDFVLKEVNFWERDKELLKINPSGELPVLSDNGNMICGLIPIVEYINESDSEEISLIGVTPVNRAEARRVAVWFNEKFYREVTKHILTEKIIKYYKKITDTNSNAIRAAKTNILYHLDYINHLLSKNDWLGGENISIADFAAASQLSILDYFADVPWEHNRNVRDWYSVIKSRPSFREILNDKIQGFNASSHYADLDF